MKKLPGEGATRTLTRLSLALLVVICVLINLLGDRTWWTVALLYGPRWIWGIAVVGILPQFLRRPSKGVWPLLTALLLFGFGVLDLRIGFGRLTAPEEAILRVMEFNAEGDNGEADKASRIVAYITREKPDIVVIAECGKKTLQLLRGRLPGYGSRDSFSLCMLTKGEILTWEIRDPGDFWQRYGSGAIVRSDVQLGGKKLRIGLVHLATPRRALVKYNDSTKVESMREATATNLELRDLESQAARFWITNGNSAPTIIAGDFNLPVASAIYRRHWGDLQNAFSSTGRGLGYTRQLTLWGVRIDHILAANGVQTVRSWIGTDLGSDHLPIMADLNVER